MDDKAISEILTVRLLRSARNDKGHIDPCERIRKSLGSSSAGKEHPFTSASNAFARYAINSVEMAVGLCSGIFLAL